MRTTELNDEMTEYQVYEPKITEFEKWYIENINNNNYDELSQEEIGFYIAEYLATKHNLAILWDEARQVWLTSRPIHLSSVYGLFKGTYYDALCKALKYLSIGGGK